MQFLSPQEAIILCFQTLNIIHKLFFIYSDNSNIITYLNIWTLWYWPIFSTWSYVKAYTPTALSVLRLTTSTNGIHLVLKAFIYRIRSSCTPAAGKGKIWPQLPIYLLTTLYALSITNCNALSTTIIRMHYQSTQADTYNWEYVRWIVSQIFIIKTIKLCLGHILPSIESILLILSETAMLLFNDAVVYMNNIYNSFNVVA